MPEVNIFFCLPSRLVFLLGVVCGILPLQAQVTQTYSPNNWTNNPYSPDTYFSSLTGANTTSPTYSAPGGTPTSSQTLYAYSPIGSTITLNAPGQTITLTGQITLLGDNGGGNNQVRFGLFYRGASPNSSGWLGYFAGSPLNNLTLPGPLRADKPEHWTLRL